MEIINYIDFELIFKNESCCKRMWSTWGLQSSTYPCSCQNGRMKSCNLQVVAINSNRRLSSPWIPFFTKTGQAAECMVEHRPTIRYFTACLFLLRLAQHNYGSSTNCKTRFQQDKEIHPIDVNRSLPSNLCYETNRVRPTLTYHFR